jgi:hypothetical protein
VAPAPLPAPPTPRDNFLYYLQAGGYPQTGRQADTAVAWAASICQDLNEGFTPITLNERMSETIDGDYAASLEVAAIKAYCPQFDEKPSKRPP